MPHGFPMVFCVFLHFFHGFPMVFRVSLHFFHGFPMVFCVFLHFFHGWNIWIFPWFKRSSPPGWGRDLGHWEAPEVGSGLADHGSSIRQTLTCWVFHGIFHGMFSLMDFNGTKWMFHGILMGFNWVIWVLIGVFKWDFVGFYVMECMMVIRLSSNNFRICYGRITQ